MAKIPPFLSKTCTRCGIEKSASAFLLGAGDRAVYSSICQACRTKQANQEKDRTTRSGTGAVIDSKTKVHQDITKQQEKQEIEEAYQEEREEKELEDTEEEEIKEEDKQKEKVRLEKNEKKHSFLESNRKVDRKEQHNKRWAIQEGVKESQDIQENMELDEANQSEQQKTQTNFAAPFEDTRVAGKLKFTGDAFKRFSSWVGQGSPVGRTIEQGNKQFKGDQPKPGEKPSEYTERKWGPGSKKP